MVKDLFHVLEKNKDKGDGNGIYLRDMTNTELIEVVSILLKEKANYARQRFKKSTDRT